MRRSIVVLAPLLLVYLLLVRRFDFLCDDAFISFRFARHLVEGQGLRFNLGAEPVEGYSNFLWVIWNALAMRLGVDPAVGSRLASLACGIHLLVSVVSFASRRLGGTTAGAVAGLFLASLAPFAAWTTGGLATMPFAWALFLAYERFAGAERPRPLTAGLFALAACLLRSDGPVFVAMVFGSAVLASGRDRRAETFRAAARSALVVIAGLLPYHVWRVAYFGDWVPQTARVKVTFTAVAMEQGAKYLATLLATFPSLLLALFLPAARPAPPARPIARATTLAAATGYIYVLVVGGDWMALGRFVVPVLPFIAIAFAARAAPRPEATRLSARTVLALVVIALSWPGAFDRAPVPHRLLEALHFRWNSDVVHTEVGFWRAMREDLEELIELGHALRTCTKRGDSIVLGAIGAAAYYSELFVFDRNGLVTRTVTGTDGDEPARRSPGHLRNVDPLFFLSERPTILRAKVVPDSAAADAIRLPVPRHAGYARVVLPLDPAAGFAPGRSLVTIRRD